MPHSCKLERCCNSHLAAHLIADVVGTYLLASPLNFGAANTVQAAQEALKQLTTERPEGEALPEIQVTQSIDQVAPFVHSVSAAAVVFKCTYTVYRGVLSRRPASAAVLLLSTRKRGFPLA